MANVVVVGAQWGDEGKGKIVDHLTEHADVVARFAGGANAGHTLVVDGQKVVTHLLPSGVLRPDVICVLGDGMVIDPKVLLEEIAALRNRGRLERNDELLIGQSAHVVTPYHLALDAAREQGHSKIGTTRRGIGPAYECKVARRGIRVADLLSEDRLRPLITRGLEEVCPDLERLSPDKQMKAALGVDAIVATLLKQGEALRPFVRDTSRFLHEQMMAGKHVLFEGAQGALLDIDHGTYPFVTSSNTVAGGACTGCGIGPTFIDEVIGISKVYSTRVGDGPFPTELDGAAGDRLRAAGGEFGATTGRPRRVGWLDLAALRVAARTSGMTGLALTKFDILSKTGPVSVNIGYKLDGQTLDEIPLDPRDIARAQPIYETLPGWDEDLSSVRALNELPKNIRGYIEYIEKAIKVPVTMISFGAGREATLLLANPFA